MLSSTALQTTHMTVSTVMAVALLCRLRGHVNTLNTPNFAWRRCNPTSTA